MGFVKTVRNHAWPLGILLALFSVIGCSQREHYAFLQGTWRGAVVKNGEEEFIKLDLQVDKGDVKGSMMMLGAMESGVLKGIARRAWPIASSTIEGNKLRFVVPITDESDGQSVTFQLEIQGNQLLGNLQGMQKDSQSSPITFTKQK